MSNHANDTARLISNAQCRLRRAKARGASADVLAGIQAEIAALRSAPTSGKRAEVEHDERWLELLNLAHAAGEKRRKALRSLCELASVVDGSNVYRLGAQSFRGEATYRIGEASKYAPHATAEDALPIVADLANGVRSISDLSYSGWARRAGETVAKFHAADDAWRTAVAEVALHEESYTGWTRFMLVTSSSGHVHKDMHCSTCNVRTTFAPVPSLSGLDESGAVGEIGEALCTVCFPSAPVKPSKITQAQALVLLTEGEEAFTRALTLAAAKRRAKAARG